MAGLEVPGCRSSMTRVAALGLVWLISVLQHGGSMAGLEVPSQHEICTLSSSPGSNDQLSDCLVEFVAVRVGKPCLSSGLLVKSSWEGADIDIDLLPSLGTLAAVFASSLGETATKGAASPTPPTISSFKSSFLES